MKAAAIVMAGMLAACSNDAGQAQPAGNAMAAPQKPVLGLLTSLPILFAPRFSLEGGSPLLTALEQTYDVQAIATTDAASLAGKDVLFMAHALPQTADNLVALDEWVRGGGRLLLLADPMLAWETGLPLGSPQAPPYYFGDTGLLGHWGLTLEGPVEDARQAGVAAKAAGRFTSNGACGTREGGFIADCLIGRGHATLIADADFLEDGDPVGIALIGRELGALSR